MADEKKKMSNWLNRGRDTLNEQLNKAKSMSEDVSKQTQATLSSQGEQIQKTIEGTTESVNNIAKSIVDQSSRLTDAITRVDTSQFVSNVAKYHERFLGQSFDGKPGILVTGRTGAGKSTLINHLIGNSVAQTGSGEPITMEIAYYASDNLYIDLYDSPGWEGGDEKAKKFLNDIQTILSDKKNEIQIIWYVIDAQSTRLVDFEIELLRELLGDKPIALILTKCDIATDEQIIGLLRAIIEIKIPTVIGAYEVAAQPLQKLPSEIQERFSSINPLKTSYELLGIVDS